MYQLLHDALPYLFAFYLFDGIRRIEAGQIVLLGAWGAWRPRSGRLLLAGWWPAAEMARGYDPPVLITESGFYVARGGGSLPILRRDDLELYTFDGAAALACDGRHVTRDGRRILKTPTETAARHVVGLLQAVAQAPSGQRQAAFRRWLAGASDLGSLRDRHARYETHARRLVALAAASFLVLFVLIPVLLTRGPEAADPLVLAVAAVVVLHAGLVWQARRALRAVEAVSTNALAAMALFPPGAIHAPLVATEELFAVFHPLAVAAALLPPATFESLARRERHRLEVAVEAARGTDTEDAWRVRLEALDALVVTAHADAARVRSAPPRTDESAAGYCPLCFTEYRAGFDSCADCGAAVRAFS